MASDKPAARGAGSGAVGIDSRNGAPALDADTTHRPGSLVRMAHVAGDAASSTDAGPTESDRAKYPGLASALNPTKSQFRAVAQARMYSQGPMVSSSAQREAMTRFYPNLLLAFEERYGSAEYHWCAHAPAAAVLTNRRRRWRAECRLWLVLNPGTGWRDVEAALTECSVLKDEIEDSLRGSARGRCLRMLFEIMTTALAMLDEFAAPASRAGDVGAGESLLRRAIQRCRAFLDARALSDRTKPARPTVRSAVEDLNSRIETARTQYERAARRAMQLVYLSGMFVWTMLIAAAAVAMLSIAGTSFAETLAVDGTGTQRAIVSSLAGTTGAFMSVLLRMTREQGVDVDVLVGRPIGHLLGASRPLLGAISGIAVYLLLASGVVPLAPTDPDFLAEFYAVFAFAAGFSERLVPDMLGVATKQLHPGGA